MATISPLPIRARSSLPTYPNGWFRVAASGDVVADAMFPVTYFGRHFIVFRAPDGSPRVADAYCPHLGAHLASHTGSLKDGTITCPFHRWQFETDGGACTKINYSKVIPPRARLKMYPAVEGNGMIMMWFHDQDAEPDHQPWIEPRLADEPWLSSEPMQWRMHAQQQEFMENIFDSAHILELHNSETLPRFVSCDDHGTGMTIILDIDVPDPEYPVSKCINHYSGISVTVQHNLSRTENFIAISFTPVDEETVEMNARIYFKDLGSDEANGVFGKMFTERWMFEVEQDLAILNHKKHLERPLLCAGDGPIMRWREYARRFYSESPAIAAE